MGPLDTGPLACYLHIDGGASSYIKRSWGVAAALGRRSVISPVMELARQEGLLTRQLNIGIDNMGPWVHFGSIKHLSRFQPECLFLGIRLRVSSYAGELLSEMCDTERNESALLISILILLITLRSLWP